MKKRDKTEGSSVYINRGTGRTRNRFFWRKGDVYENTYGRVCRVRNAHLFLRWSAWEPGQPKTEIIWRPGYSIFVER